MRTPTGAQTGALRGHRQPVRSSGQRGRLPAHVDAFAFGIMQLPKYYSTHPLGTVEKVPSVIKSARGGCRRDPAVGGMAVQVS